MVSQNPSKLLAEANKEILPVSFKMPKLASLYQFINLLMMLCIDAIETSYSILACHLHEVTNIYTLSQATKAACLARDERMYKIFKDEMIKDFGVYQIINLLSD